MQQLPPPALDSCGTHSSATLTFIGYKGGDPIIKSIRTVPSSFLPITFPQKKEDETTTTTTRLLGVFDGHAKLGEGVSQHVVEHLPTILADKLNQIYHSQNTKH